MAFTICAVLPSGKQLPSLAVELSWTGAQVKVALSQHIEKPGYISALMHKDKIIADDQTLQDSGLSNAERRSIDVNVVVSELVKLGDVALLPGMSTEYKFNHWSGDEIYPDEEAEYRDIASKTECFFLTQKVPSERPLVNVALPQEWVDLYNKFVEENGGGEFNSRFLRRKIDSHFGPIKLMLKNVPLNDAVKQTLSNSYEGLDRVDFKLTNNDGATAKYQIVDGHSMHPIRFADHDTPLYLLFVGSVEFQKTELQIRLNHVYLSDNKFCGVHRPFYM